MVLKWVFILILLGSIAGLGPSLIASVGFNSEIKNSDEESLKNIRAVIATNFSPADCKEKITECGKQTQNQMLAVISPRHSAGFYSHAISELNHSLFSWTSSEGVPIPVRQFRMAVLERMLISAKGREKNPVEWLAKDDAADFLKFQTSACGQYSEDLNAVQAEDSRNATVPGALVIETEKFKVAFDALCEETKTKD